MRNIGILIALVMASPVAAFNTKQHLRATINARDFVATSDVTGGQYPDIARFGDTIINWSAGANTVTGVALGLDTLTPAEQLAHTLDQTLDICDVPWNGGDFDTIIGRINDRYAAGNYAQTRATEEGAYVYIGSALHLIEDQASMPHGANIHHGVCPFQTFQDWWPTHDHFETPFDKVNAAVSGNTLYNFAPPTAYRASLGVTRGIAGLYISSASGVHYWYKNEELTWDTALVPQKSGTPYNGEAGPGDQLFGEYGGVLLGSVPGPDADIYSHVEQPELYGQQGQQAADLAYWFLRRISESLPPRPSQLEIDGAGGGAPPIINNQTGTSISFAITENRTEYVDIDFYIQETGQRIVTETGQSSLDGAASASGVTVTRNLGGPLTWLAQPLQLFGTKSDLALLPYQANVITFWKGKVASGNPLADGTYTLCMTVKDRDANGGTCDASGLFAIDATSPTVHAFDSADHDITNSTSTKNHVFVRAIDPVPGSGVRSFSISPHLYQDVFFDGNDANTAGDEAEVEYEALPDGQYTVTVIDNAGNPSVTHFIVDSTPPDAEAYSATGQTITNGGTRDHVFVRATDPTPGSGVHIFSIAPDDFEDVVFEGADANAAGEQASVEYEAMAEANYTVTVKDNAGNEKAVKFTIDRTFPVITSVRDYEGLPIPPNGETATGIISVRGTDNLGIAKIRIVDGGGATVSETAFELGAASINLPVSGLPDNPEGQKYTIQVYDRGGNMVSRSFGVHHAPFVGLNFYGNAIFDYEFDYYGTAQQTFSIPIATMSFAIRDTAGIQTFELIKEGNVYFSQNYADEVTANLSMTLPGGVYAFSVTTTRGKTTSGVFTVYNEYVNADFNRSGASAEGNAAHDMKFPVKCFNNGPEDTGLTEAVIRPVRTTADGHVFDPPVATVACDGNFVGRLPSGLYAVMGDDHGYDVASYFRIDDAPSFVRFPSGGYDETEPITLDYVSGGTTADGFVLRGLGSSGLYPAEGHVTTIPVDLFQPLDNFVVPDGAIGVALVGPPSDGLEIVPPSNDDEDNVAGDTGISQSFSIAQASGSPAGESFQDVGKWSVILVDGEVEHELSGENPMPLQSPIRFRQTLTSNVVSFFKADPHAYTPLGHFSTFPLSYVTGRVGQTVEDLPQDVFGGQPDVHGNFAFELKSPHFVTIELGDPNDPTIRALLAQLASSGLSSPGGNIYVVDPPVINFGRPAQATMRFSSATAVERGFDPGQLALYQAEPGGPFVRVPNQSLDPSGTIMADVTRLSERSLFAIFGPTPATDSLPPRTTLTGSPTFSSTSTLYVGAGGYLGFTVADDAAAVGDGAGVGSTRTRYSVDGGTFTVFTGTFSLAAEGVHSARFYSVDLRGRVEALKTRSIGVDLTPPVSTLAARRGLYEIAAIDPLVAGVASGAGAIRYLVDVATSACAGVTSNPAMNRGTCANPAYAAAFPLAPGPHTVAISASDNAGNTEPFRVVSVSAVDQQAAGSLGLGSDPADSFWSVVREEGAVSFARGDSSGTMISSAALQDALTGVPWAVFFDLAGRAYAVGSAAGAGTQAVDVGIYKASASGGAIESRLLYDSGYGSNDFSFDAKSPGWITGAAQTAGSDPSDGKFALALWRFDPALGTVQLATSSARAGLDVGTGLGVDGDGSVWIAGYSQNPDASGPRGLDLSLWHYTADGHTPAGGPYRRPRYLSNVDGGLTARVYVAADAVYVAAPKTNASGAADMAFLKFDKSGQLLAESAWRSGDGESAYPAAILPEASDILVVGGTGNDFTQAALWRYGYDGALQSATETDAGGATGAVFRGSQLWLSVDGSTAPYRVQSESAASGALIDVRPPRTTIVGGDPAAVVGDVLYVTDESPIRFETGDDKLALNDGLGVGATQTFYAADGGGYSRFSSPINLVAEGTHTVTMFSVDREGNVEEPAAAVVGVDMTAPAAELVAGASAYSIVAADPSVAGAASGVGPIFYLVDRQPDECGENPFDTAAARGTCENPVYAGPFVLDVGTHTVFFQAQDNVGNGNDVLFSSFVTVGAPPASLAVVPASGPIGVPFTISGAGFGTYGGGDTRVKFGTAAAPLSVWNDGTISGTVPGLPSGTYAVTIERQNASSVTVTAAGTFQVTAPSASAVSPSTGPIGIPFSIAGAGFGPYAGGDTRVKFGASVAALSVWNDTLISGTVPALATGTYGVVVERQQGSEVVSSAASSFTVTALSIGSLTPASGPVGAPFTVTGTGFGPYAGGNTRLLIGGVAAALSVWNDTTITGTVPTLAAGPQSLWIERASGAGLQSSDTAYFTVVVPSVTAISPSSGPIGVAFTLTGTGFGPYAGGNTRVLIGGATAALSVWNDTTIVGAVPGSLPTGPHAVTVTRVGSDGGEVDSSAGNFQVTGMSVDALSPASGPIGAPFTLTGSQFGTYGGGNTRVRFGGALASLSVWNDTTISGTVPNLATGTVTVVVERQQGSDVALSNLSSFTVVALSAAGISPSSGPIGTMFTVTGSGFGPYNGANTRALIGGVVAALSVWNDGTVAGTVPGALAPGTYPAWLERSSGDGVQSSATSYFTVTAAAVTSLSPASAPIGAPFTITGTSFGAYAGGNTRVKFGGVAAPLSVWNDTTISGTVPGELTPGPVEVVVERAADAGLSASATQAFAVTTPEISSIAPGFGAPGTVVSLTGTSFGPYAGGATKVLLGGATVPLSVWNDAAINWTVPGDFADGTYPVVVVREPAGGSVQSASATFTVGTGYGGMSLGFAAVQPLAARPDSHFQGDLSVSSTTGGRIDTPAKAAVEIPPNAMDADKEITLKRLRSDGLRVRAAEEIKKRAAGEPIEFGPEGARFSAPVTIELPYDPALTADESKIAIHYFNPLRRAWEELPSEVDRARRVVKAKTDHFSIYQPMGLAPTTAAQDEFYYRDSYAYPNPSRGGSLVTFRIQPGLAETVEVRVYDVSGRKLHDSTDFTFLGAIDDGNGKGAQDTYDHGWNVSGVGSGVYTYVIKASRGGQKPIVKSGKVGVIK